MDVTDFDQCGEVISDIIKEFGNIDVLINNAGITRDAVFTKMTKKQWDEVLTVNLDGMFNVTRHVVENMREHESGRIVNISSVNAQKRSILAGQLCRIKGWCLWVYQKFGTGVNE